MFPKKREQACKSQNVVPSRNTCMVGNRPTRLIPVSVRLAIVTFTKGDFERSLGEFLAAVIVFTNCNLFVPFSRFQRESILLVFFFLSLPLELSKCPGQCKKKVLLGQIFPNAASCDSHLLYGDSHIRRRRQVGLQPYPGLP